MGSIVGRKGKFFAAHFWDFAGPKNCFVSKSHKIVETLYSNGVPSENKTINTPPLPSIQGWGVCSFLQLARGAAQHFMEEMGEEKLHFLFFRLANC